MANTSWSETYGMFVYLINNYRSKSQKVHSILSEFLQEQYSLFEENWLHYKTSFLLFLSFS